MAVQLVSRFGTWKLPDGDLVLGRHSQADLHIDDIRLSRRHAEFRVEGSRVVLKDLGSVNGILLNGERIAGMADLKHGDLVVIGPIAFTVEIDTQTASHLELERPGYARQTSQLEFKPSTERALRTTADMESEELAALAKVRTPPAQPVLDGDALATLPAGSIPVGGGEGSSSLAPMPPPPTAALRIADAPEEPADRQKSTDQLRPLPKAKGKGTAPLTPKDPVAALRQELRSIRGRRVLAGVLDPVSALLLATLAAALPLWVGLGLALQRAGVGLGGGTLHLGSGNPAGLGGLLAHVLTPSGMAQAWNLLEPLRQEHRPAFLIVFVGATIGALLAALVVLFALIAATIVKGAPFWHRFLGLTIRELTTDAYPSVLRSAGRWLLLPLALPALPLCLLLGWRSLPDVIAGCRVSRPDFSSRVRKAVEAPPT